MAACPHAGPAELGALQEKPQENQAFTRRALRAKMASDRGPARTQSQNGIQPGAQHALRAKMASDQGAGVRGASLSSAAGTPQTPRTPRRRWTGAIVQSPA